MIKLIENNDILLKIEKFLKSRETVFMDKQFDSLCKINNPFGFVDKGNIEEIENTRPDLIKDLSWQDFSNKHRLNLQIDSKTSINLIQQLDKEKYGDKEFENLYWPSGHLGKNQIDIILSILKNYGDINQIICYYSFLTNLHFDTDKDELYVTDFLGFKNLIEKRNYFTPTIWWEKELHWVVYTDYDLTNSYILGDEIMIENLTTQKDLESFRLNKTDYSSDLDKSLYKLIE